MRSPSARALDARRTSGGGSRLAGVPIGVKDIIATAGMPTQMGSPIFAGAIPARDAECIARLDRAGGMVLGKTVTTEFAFMQPGKTRNPWNAACTPGGSSSGSAAAVALGQVPAAIGTQTNGSVIRPAAYCGVVGFKPGKDLLPFAGVHRFSPTLDTLGVFARTVADCALLAGALAGEGAIAPRAMASLQARRRWPGSRSFHGWRPAANSAMRSMPPRRRFAAPARASRALALPPTLPRRADRSYAASCCTRRCESSAHCRIASAAECRPSSMRRWTKAARSATRLCRRAGAARRDHRGARPTGLPDSTRC